MDEIWKPIPGYEGLYEVSDQGRIKSLAKEQVWPNGRNRSVVHCRHLPERILRPFSTNGYLRVTLQNGQRRRCLVHRLVLEAFVRIADDMDCNHKNGIRGDNRVQNLEWVTRSENEQHKRSVLKRQILDENPAAKLTSEAVQDIRARAQNYTRGLWSRLARQYGVSNVAVRKAAFNETWRTL